MKKSKRKEGEAGVMASTAEISNPRSNMAKISSKKNSL